MMQNKPEMSVFHPDRSGIRQVLGDLEAEIMEVVWERPAGQGTTVHDAFEVLYERRHLAYTTVMTTMKRLAKKHLLRAETKEHAHVYYPTDTKSAFISRFVGWVLEGLLTNFTGMPTDQLPHLSDPQVRERARALFDEVAHRTVEQEKEDSIS
jgi:predicted transcriptional regulator